MKRGIDLATRQIIIGGLVYVPCSRNDDFCIKLSVWTLLAAKGATSLVVQHTQHTLWCAMFTIVQDSLLHPLDPGLVGWFAREQPD